MLVFLDFSNSIPQLFVGDTLPPDFRMLSGISAGGWDGSRNGIAALGRPDRKVPINA